VAVAGNTPRSNVFNGNNQMTGVSYDAAGNQLTVNGDVLAYDAENRVALAVEPQTLGGAAEKLLLQWSRAKDRKMGAQRRNVVCVRCVRAIGVRVHHVDQYSALHDLLFQLGSSGEHAPGYGSEWQCGGAA